MVAAQAVGARPVVTSVATAGLLLGEPHLRGNAMVAVRRQVRDDLALPAPVVMARVRVLGETSARTTGVVASAIVVNAGARVQQPRARVAVAVAVVVVVAAAAKITTKTRRPAASSTTSTIGIRPSYPTNPGSARRSAGRRAFGVGERLPSASP